MRRNGLRLLVSTGLGLQAFAAQAEQPENVEPQGNDIVVTAQKRSERLQDVPLSIQVLDSRTLTQRNISNFDDYAKYIPNLSYESIAPGYAEVFFRGISNGNRLSTGSLPTVGVYLDEQPVTTIGATVDIHVYDIARIEALAGPQGTLFGASSEAGTLRIITNKPDPEAFSAGIDVTGNVVSKGSVGGSLEGFINMPLSERIALRLVGYALHDGGYIDNVAAPAGQVYPTSGIVRENADFVEKDANGVDTYGGRAALGIDLDDNWTANVTLVGQHQRSSGTFAYRPEVGDLQNIRYAPDRTLDKWAQAALVISGKVSDFDLTYAAAYFERTAEYVNDYSDYAYFYDRYYSDGSFGDQFFNDSGTLINPAQILSQRENFTKQSHELRIASPTTDKFRLTAGLFFQRQTNDWRNLYSVPDLAVSQSVTGLPGVNYANIQYRTDRDYAAFAEASWDVAPQLTLTAGLRGYKYDNTVVGFFGYNADRSEVGEALCLPNTVGLYGTQRPCDNIDASASGEGFRHRLTTTWKPDNDRMLYVTWSTGFRPGGINRRALAAPYDAEKLSNYELGWKTVWLNGKLRVNGALFIEKLDQTQFAVTSDQNGITDIVNAGAAESKGIEADVTITPIQGLSWQTSATYLRSRITTDLCSYANPQNDCSIPSPGGNPNSIVSLKGTRFPATPRFKLSSIARYDFDLGAGRAFLQAAVVHQSSVSPSLANEEVEIIGLLPARTAMDAAVGFSVNDWSLGLYVENIFDDRGAQLRTTACDVSICGDQILVHPVKPRMVSVRLARKF